MNLKANMQMAWRLLRRQRGRIWLFLFCVAVGSAARVSVGSFMQRLDEAVRRDARVLLAADLELSDSKPLRPSRREQLTQWMPEGGRTLDRVSLLTMAGTRHKEGRSRLCQLAAVESGYPFFGTYDIRAKGKPASLALLHGKDATVLVAPSLLPQLNVKEGDYLQIGDKAYRIAGQIFDEPGLGSGVLSLGPRVLMGLEHLDGAGLTGAGSRARYETLVALNNASQAMPLAETLREAWNGKSGERRGRARAGREDGMRVRTHQDSQDEIKRFFEELAEFLNLVSLMALLLGGIGVASVTRGFIADQAESIGIYRVLGASGKIMTRVYFLQCLALGLAGGLLGALLGTAAQVALPFILGPFLPVAISPAPVFSAMLWGPALGLGVAGLFSLLPVSEILNTRPADLFRDGLEGAKAPRRAWLGAALGYLALLGLAAWEADDFKQGAGFLLAVSLGALVLWLLARGLLPRLAAWRPLQAGLAFRFGLSNLHRPGRRSAASVMALGCAALLLGVLAVYQHSLLWELNPRKAEGDLPSLFMIDVQDDQVQEVRKVLESLGAHNHSFSPMVRGRFKGINVGTKKEREGLDSRWQNRRNRERNLSYRESMGPGETVVEGRWFDPQSEIVEVSLEQEWADRRGAELGDTLRFDVHGVLIDAKVTSLRRVHWASFQPNFFVLLSPWALQNAPKTWVGAVNGLSRAERERAQNAVAKAFPSVTQIDVAVGVRKVMDAMDKISLAIQFIALFALGAGLVVLAGIALASARERRSESALLKALGGRRRQLVAAVAVEFGTLGLLSGILGSTLALALGWFVTTALANIPLEIPWWRLAGLSAGLALLCALTGAAVCWRVFSVKPLVALREE